MAEKPTYEELEQRLKRIEHELQEYRDDREGLMEEHSAGLLDSEAKVENLMDIVPIGLSISTPGAKGTITDINSTLFKIFGYSSKDEYLKIPASSHYYNPKDRKVFSELNKHGPVTNYETRFKRKDGTVFWGSLSAVTRITEDGNIEFVSVFEDITKRKQAQEALRESEARLAKAQQITHIGNWNRTIITNNKWWSDELYRIVGLSPKKADANDEAYIKYVHPDDLVMFKNLTEKALKEKKAYSLEYRIIRPDNEIRFVHEQGDITLDTKGNPTDLFGTVQDITERKHAKMQYQTILQTAIDGFWLVDAQGHLLDVNNAICKMLGYRREELLQIHISKIDTVETQDEITSHIQKVKKQGDDRFETRYRREDGTIIDVELNVQYMDFKNGMFICFIRDITTKKQSEKELRKSEERFKTIADFAYNWETWIDPDGKYIHVSPSFERITGYKPEKLLKDHQFVETIIHPDDRKQLLEHKFYRTGESPVHNLDFRIIHRNGDTRWISHTCQPVYDSYGNFHGRRASNRDVTEQKKIEAQLQQAQKMETVGRLAGGVAHDFNNALSVIISTSELTIDDVAPTGQLREDLNEILMAAKRAADITRQLLAFARKQTISPKVLDLNKNVKSMLKMLRRLIGEDIDLAWLPGANLWTVKLDPTQIDQVLANLCVNARDAIEGVGKVTIESENITFSENYCANHPGFVPGEFVLLAVSDNGCGMDKEILDNIFEPFFTTKDVDKGTGLGLATVYGIVKQNNGFINVYSEPGKGTTIKVYLSRHKDKAVEIRKKNTTEIPSSQGETILVVEDDPAILKIMQKILEGLGYTVLTSNAPEKVMDIVKKYTGNIHLLITDVIMPEMNGRDLAEQLQSICPNLKCMFMSGYTANAIVHQGVLDKGINFIQKPFSRRELAETIRKALDK